MTPITKREIPDGYQLPEQTSDIWRALTLFQWSEVFKCYLEIGPYVTCRPNETIGEALAKYLDGHQLSNCGNDYELFERVE